MKAKLDSQKTALKLVNQYADSYKVLELENKTLKKELEDIQANLLINKSMIVNMVNPNKLSSNEKTIMEALKAEISSLSSTLLSCKAENSDLKRLLNSSQSNLEPILLRGQKTIENLSNKIFVLENNISKKDNQIKQLNSKNEELVYNKIVSGNSAIQEIGVKICLYH